MRADGYCECGCGKRTKIAPNTNSRRGWIRGQPMRWLRGHAGGRKHPGYRIDETSGCWNWNGFVNAEGYAQMQVHGKQLRAHRVYYERIRGPIPPGHQLHHICNNRRCVNPDHLQVLTASDHSKLLPVETRVAILTGRPVSAETRAKLSAAHKGKTLSAEHRRKISEAGRGRVKSPEERAKRSASLKAYWARKRSSEHQ